ncbi:hypothetical protein HMPREF3224_01474 [Anaerococcus hydrogenalis]|nr:hypothetical protein HMPREF3224_01474 [Anaerococcus hydrogenalis]
MKIFTIISKGDIMAVLELTVVPIGTKETSVSKYVAGCEKVLKEYEDLEVRLNPMGTVIHGDIDRAFEAIRACQESVFKNGADRVYSVIKIDDRRDKKASLDQKIKSVEDKM